MSAANLIVAPAAERHCPLLPRWVGEEWLFWLAFASWTVLPSTRTPIWTVADLPVKSTDVLLIPLCLLYLLPQLLVQGSRHGRGWHLGLPLVIVALTAFGTISTYWSGAPDRAAAGMRYTMAVTAASGLLACLVIASVSQVREFLWRMSRALSAVGLLYTAQSMLGLGLRSAAAVTLNDFGMERVRGPLFEASTGYFLLIPALAFVLQETLAKRVRTLSGFGCALALTLTILGLGSRAGFALLGLFALSSIWVFEKRSRLIAIVTIAAIVGTGAALVFSKAKADRLQSTAKDGRTIMHEAVARILASRMVSELLTGSGLGSWWPWYITELEGGNLYATGRYVRRTTHGMLLYHPHSTVLVLVVEFGLAGVLFLVLIARVLFSALRRAFLTGRNVVFAWGLAVSSLSFGFDLFLLRRPTRDAVWWVMLFGLLAMLEREKKERGAGRQ